MSLGILRWGNASNQKSYYTLTTVLYTSDDVLIQCIWPTWLIDWLSMVLRLRQHNIGYTADGFYRSDMTCQCNAGAALHLDSAYCSIWVHGSSEESSRITKKEFGGQCVKPVINCKNITRLLQKASVTCLEVCWVFQRVYSELWQNQAVVLPDHRRHTGQFPRVLLPPPQPYINHRHTIRTKLWKYNKTNSIVMEKWDLVTAASSVTMLLPVSRD